MTISIEMSGSETSPVHFYCSDFESYDDLGVPSIWNFCGSLDDPSAQELMKTSESHRPRRMLYVLSMYVTMQISLSTMDNKQYIKITVGMNYQQRKLAVKKRKRQNLIT
ncbi:hypothetical protein F2Q69_00027370 [Brassica cretica]|uniref:Uncharacterized protein n=1 Tax=Brassica cretica TaxID=69181 RepID=A0A8S9S7W6_BRACR|nr:hypothetical protein F2Q69_00027370 [Brassica cretica]